MIATRRSHLLAALLLCSGLATLAADPPQKNEPQKEQTPESSEQSSERQLDGVTVKGKHDLLSESDRKLKELQRSLPDLNSDAPKKEGLAERAVNRTREYISSHKDPNKLDDDSKAFLERIQNPLDRQRTGSVQPPLRPDARDYVDPLCQAGSCPP